MEPLNPIAGIFNQTFRAWDITLPPEDLANRRRGVIHQAGWSIQYLFGEDQHGLYLDYYATHRMTNDRHTRLYENGTVEPLEAPLELMAFPPGCSKEQAAEIEKQYFENNRRIYAELARKGFKI